MDNSAARLLPRRKLLLLFGDDADQFIHELNQFLARFQPDSPRYLFR